jgi:hypothetical protein
MKALNTKLLGLLFVLISTSTLFSQQITLLNPNGGNSINGFTQYDIEWQSSGVDSVKIYFTSDNGANWTFWTREPASSGSYTWTVPPNIPSSDCRILIEDNSNPAIRDSSDSTFTIVSFVKLIKPNGGETLLTNRTYEIKWTSVGVSRIWLSFTIDDGLSWGGIASNVNPADSTYTWNVPEAPTTKARVRLFYADNIVADTSDTTFSIISTLGVNELEVNSPLVIYPNPSSGNITVELNNKASNQPLTFKVADILGKILFEQTVSNSKNKTELNLNNSIDKSGIYFLLVSDGETSFRKKFTLNK